MSGLLDGVVTDRLSKLELPPPGAGVTTWTNKVSADCRKRAGTTASNSVELMNVVCSGTRFNCTTEVAAKFAPRTCKFKTDVPASTAAGVMNEITGISAGVPPAASKLTAVTLSLPTVTALLEGAKTSAACEGVIV